ncbi:MAG: hypothetical protein ACPL1Y_01100 [Thermoplasmata archaeon]
MSSQIIHEMQRSIEEYVGPFLSEVITKKALVKVGGNKENYTVEDLKKALEMHIVPALYALLSKEKVQECRRKIESKIKEM